MRGIRSSKVRSELQLLLDKWRSYNHDRAVLSSMMSSARQTWLSEIAVTLRVIG